MVSREKQHQTPHLTSDRASIPTAQCTRPDDAYPLAQVHPSLREKACEQIAILLLNRVANLGHPGVLVPRLCSSHTDSIAQESKVG